MGALGLYGTESKRTESRGGAGKIIVALQLSILSLSSLLICFLILSFAGTGNACMLLFNQEARLVFCIMRMNSMKKGEENEVMGVFFSF